MPTHGRPRFVGHAHSPHSIGGIFAQPVIGARVWCICYLRPGISVALSTDGNTAIVGGENDDSSTGAAWVFVRSGGSWAEQRKLVGTGADFDGDGKADFLWRHSGGDVAVWLMNGTAPTSEVDVGNVPTVWQIVSTGDYDGDGKGDILWRQSGGDVSVWEMNGATAKSTVDIGNVPTAWTVVE